MSPNQNSRVHALSVRLAVSGLLLMGGAAVAGRDSTIDFEPPDYNGSSAGVVATGQQGWYLPDVAGSTDQFIFTYDGNALGLPANPFGDTQFLGGQTPLTGDLRRAQLDFDWSQASIWTACYDIATGYNGILPAQDFLGSFSLQDSLVAKYFVAVNGWVNPDTADQWNALYIVFDSNGSMIDPMGVSPGAAWQNLAVNHWYNECTTFCFDTNEILTVSITNLDTGDTASLAPKGWFMQGGADPTQFPRPTALRFFVGGGPGNVGGYDNLTIHAIAGAVQQNPGVSPSVLGTERRSDVSQIPATN